MLRYANGSEADASFFFFFLAPPSSPQICVRKGKQLAPVPNYCLPAGIFWTGIPANDNCFCKKILTNLIFERLETNLSMRNSFLCIPSRITAGRAERTQSSLVSVKPNIDYTVLRQSIKCRLVRVGTAGSHLSSSCFAGGKVKVKGREGGDGTAKSCQTTATAAEPATSQRFPLWRDHCGRKCPVSCP